MQEDQQLNPPLRFKWKNKPVTSRFTPLKAERGDTYWANMMLAPNRAKYYTYFANSGRPTRSLKPLGDVCKKNQPNNAAYGYQELRGLPTIPNPQLSNLYTRYRAASASTNLYGQKITANNAASASDRCGQQPTASNAPKHLHRPRQIWLLFASGTFKRIVLYIILAYRVEQTASRIPGQLRGNEYDIIVGQVVANPSIAQISWESTHAALVPFTL